MLRLLATFTLCILLKHAELRHVATVVEKIAEQAQVYALYFRHFQLEHTAT